MPNRPTAPAASADTEPWGRVDDDGTVSVREADGWRVVGQYPDGTAEEALAYYERKYADLASEVALLEVRHRRGGASGGRPPLRPRSALNAKLQDAAAVGDLAALDARVLALTDELAEASETEAAAAREAVDDAVRARTELVEKAEALAARDPRSVQWKQASAELSVAVRPVAVAAAERPSTAEVDRPAAVEAIPRRARDGRQAPPRVLRRARRGAQGRARPQGPSRREGRGARARRAKTASRLPRAARPVEDRRSGRQEGRRRAVGALQGGRRRAVRRARSSARRRMPKRPARRSTRSARCSKRHVPSPTSPTSSRRAARSRRIQRQWDEIGRIFPRDKERVLDDDLRKIEQALRTSRRDRLEAQQPRDRRRARTT